MRYRSVGRQYDTTGYEPYFDPGVGAAVLGQPVASAIVPARLANPGIVAAIPGKALPGVEGAGYCPLTPVAFTALAPLAQNMIGNPQEPMGPSRLILDDAWVFAAGAPLLTVTAFTIGNRNVHISAGAAPIGMFRPDAVGNPARGIAISPGMQIVVTVAINAIAGADTADVAGALVGATIA